VAGSTSESPAALMTSNSAEARPPMRKGDDQVTLTEIALPADAMPAEEKVTEQNSRRLSVVATLALSAMGLKVNWMNEPSLSSPAVKMAE